MKDKYFLPLMLLKFTSLVLILFSLMFIFIYNFTDENPPINEILEFSLYLWGLGIISVIVVFGIIKLIFKYL